MTRLERSIYIEGSTDDIDAVTLDPHRLPDWYAGVERVEPDDVFPEPDGMVRMVYKAGPATLNIDMTTLELERGDHALYRMDGMMEGTTRWTHIPEGDGTRLEALFEYELPGGGLGKVADRLVVERMNVQNLEKSLETLKHLVEES